ncbi:hypothetical protein DB347_05970 [Opitutaceae bacterium EW11]|nr:hypothetical protein DB347_05970 [Opitutaceae bacterium EW11]
MNDPKSKREPLSKTPSWIMLGIVIGAVLGTAAQTQWQKREQARAEAAQKAAPVPKPEPPPAPKPEPVHLPLTEMEAVFEKWAEDADWVHDVTQVAFWNPVTNQYSEYVEVLRNGEDLYFRSVPKLTRPLIDQPKDPNAPIRFTETEEEHAKKSRWIFAPAP